MTIGAYRVLFDERREHHHYLHVLLPDHAPEVVHCGGQRALGGNVAETLRNVSAISICAQYVRLDVVGIDVIVFSLRVRDTTEFYACVIT